MHCPATTARNVTSICQRAFVVLRIGEGDPFARRSRHAPAFPPESHRALRVERTQHASVVFGHRTRRPRCSCDDLHAGRSAPIGRVPSRSSSRSTHATPGVERGRCRGRSASRVDGRASRRRCASRRSTTGRSSPGGAAPASPAARRPLDDPRRDRHDAAEPGPRGRRRASGSRGSSPACSTSTSAARSRHLGLHYAPDPSSQQACTIGGNVATNAGGPHCLASGVTVGPRARGRGRARRRLRWPVLGGLEPDPPGYDLRGCFVGSEGTMGIATRIAVRLDPEPARGRARCCSTSSSIEDAGRDGERDHRRRDRARRARDDGRRDHPRGRGLRRRGLPARRRRGAARRGRRPRRRASPSQVDAVARDRARARRAHRAGRGRRRRARAAVEGPQVGVRRDRPHRARLLPARRGRPAHAARRRAPAGLRDRRRAAAHDDERVPRRRRQPAPADRLRRARAGHLGARATPPATRSSRACVDAGGVLSGEHGIGLEKRDAMPLSSRPTTSTPRPGSATRSIPPARANPRQGPARGEPLRRARSGSPRARGSDRAPARAELDGSATRSRPPHAVVPGRRPHALGGRRPAADATRRGRARRRRRRATTPPTSPSRVGAGTTVRRARRRARRAAARSARSIPATRRATVGGVARGRAVGHPPAARTGPLRDQRARGALRHRRRAAREGRRPDGEERDRLRPPAAARRLVRHDRRARPGDLRCQPASRATSSWVTTTDDPDAVAQRCFRPSCDRSGTARTTHVLLEGRRGRRRRRAATRAALEPVDAAPRCPTGAHRGRDLGRAPARSSRARRRARRHRRRALAGRVGVGHRARRRRRPRTRSAAARACRDASTVAGCCARRARPARRLRRRAAERDAACSGCSDAFDPDGQARARAAPARRRPSTATVTSA